MKENYSGSGGKPESGEPQEVTISMSVPGSFLSRAMTETEEDEIHDVDLLVFDLSGNFLYVSRARDIYTNPSLSSQKSFRAVVYEGTVDITLLANARQWIFNCYPDGIPEGTSKTDIQRNLTAEVNGQWNASATDYLVIPMWGEIGTVTINQNTSSIGDPGGVELTRMLCKIDVSTNIPVPSDFTLTSVYLYNRNTEGALIPEADLLNADLPSLASGSSVTRGPLLYDSSAIRNDANGRPACMDGIYTFEAVAGSLDTYFSTTCLVVGGLYKGVEGYYHIDFMDHTLSPAEYIPLLRNHHYEVVIQDVTEEGKGTPDEAFESFPVGIEVSIIDWNSSGMGGIDIDGNYTLKVSTDQVIINTGGGSQTMYIYTDFPDGWEMEVPVNDWLTVSTTSGAANDRVAVELTAGEYTGDSPRMLVMQVKVDHIIKRISVIQQGLGDVNLYIITDPMMLLFQKRGPGTFHIDTYPSDAPRYFSYSGDIEWEDGTFPVDGTTATSVTLVPKTNFSEKTLTGILTVYIRDEFGNVRSSNVYLRQLDYLEGFEYTISNPYPAMGGQCKFQVYAEEDWEIVDIQGAGWSPNSTGVQYADNWRDFDFTWAPNPEYEKRTVAITIETASGNGDVLFFEQDFIAPYFNITSGDIVFETTDVTKTATIEFETNCDWYMDQFNSTTNTTYGLNISSPQATIVQTGTNGVACDVATGKITINATEITDYSLPAYTEYTPTITIRSTNTGSHAQVSKQTSIKRIVPILWSLAPYNNHYSEYCFQGYSTNTGSWYCDLLNPEDGSTMRLVQGEHRLEMRSRSNIAYKMYLSTDPNTVVSRSRSANYSVSYFTIPQNNTGERTITLHVDIGDGDQTKTYNFVQDYVNPNNITLQRMGTVSASTGTWNRTALASNATLPTGGLLVYYAISGSHPDIYCGVRVNGELAPTMSGYRDDHLALSSSSVGEILVPPNFNTSSQTVEFTYSTRKDGFYVTTFQTRTQSASSTRLNSGTRRVVARGDILVHDWYLERGRANWCTALGIEDNWKNQVLDNYLNYPTVPTDSKLSCANYSEPDDGGATWRVPTLEEMTEMWQRRNEIGGLDHYVRHNHTVYWTCNYPDDRNPAYAPCADMVTGQGLIGGMSGGSFGKQAELSVRCVR